MTKIKEQVTIDEMAVSNMISIEAIVNVLMAKGKRQRVCLYQL